MKEGTRDVCLYFYQKMRHGLFSHMPWEEDPVLEEEKALFEAETERLRREGDGLSALVGFEVLTPAERQEMEDGEYEVFRSAFKSERILDFLWLDKALFGYSTVDHILGVHHLALKIARDLKKRGIPVSLGRISGAAACHDIGKYGVRPEELSRIAHYHYYYSDDWYRRHGLEAMGNIAVNHSTWDLELGSLSIESLLLIYSDFRVKNDQKGVMRYFSLEESYQVILDKLESVDELKERRYRRVYLKLVDFEGYLRMLGIPTDPFDSVQREARPEQLTLARGEEILQNYKMEGIDESIFIMHLLRSGSSMRELFELALGEKDTNLLSLYLRSLFSYHRYITPSQKDLLLDFLYELSMHPHQNIRELSATLLGFVLASYDIVYRKKRPPSAPEDAMKAKRMQRVEEMLQHYDREQPHLTEQKRFWQQESAWLSLKALLEEAPELRREFFQFLMEQEGLLGLTLGKLFLEESWCPAEYRAPLLERLLAGGEPEQDPRMMSLLRQYAPDHYEKVREEQKNRWNEQYRRAGRIDFEKIYLNNLKTETLEYDKDANLNFLMKARRGDFHLVLHLINLMKVSSSLSIRKKAGEHLLELSEEMSKEELNDISIELLRSLELKDENLGVTLPGVLARLIRALPEREIQEILEDIDLRLRERNTPKGEMLCALVVELMALLMQDETAYPELERRCLSVLASGLVQQDEELDQQVLSLIAGGIYQREEIPPRRRYDFFQKTAKKIMLLSKDFEKQLSSRLRYALYINAVYNLLSLVEQQEGTLRMPVSDKVILYYGTFDPIFWQDKKWLRRKEEEGCENYLLISDLEWREKTQPWRFRWEIGVITTADLFHSHVLGEGVIIDPEDSACRQAFSARFAPAEVRFVRADVNPAMAEALRLAIRNDWDAGDILDSLAERFIEDNSLYRQDDLEKPSIEGDLLEGIREEENTLLLSLSEGKEASLSWQEQSGGLSLSLLGSRSEEHFHDPLQRLSNEAFYQAHRRGLKELRISAEETELIRSLEWQGLRKRESGYVLSVEKPVLYLLDLQSKLLPSWRKDESIRQAICRERVHVLQALRDLYPERGVLLLDRSGFYRPILQQIEEENRRQEEALLCVPLGTLMQHHLLPHNPTLSMHIDKVLDPVDKSIFLRGQKNYQDLDHQIQNIAALSRRVLLIDDVLHTGIRLADLIPRFRAQGVEVVRVFSGMVSDAGIEQAEAHGLQVGYAYHLHQIEDWYQESDLYPLFGGLISPEDDKRESFYSLANNRIMPFIDSLTDQTDPRKFYEFSLCCIGGAKRVMKQVDHVFRQRNRRALTLRDLSGVLYETLIPEVSQGIPMEAATDPIYSQLTDLMKRFARLQP